MSEDLNHKELDTLVILQEVVTIVSAYFSHNAMPAADLPAFITAVHASVVRLASPAAPAEERAPENPAVAVKRSVTKDYIICLEDGKKFKSLRRHLSSFHNLTPDEYRAKWSLPNDYPMVAPAYSAVRSRLARDSGLGQMTKDGILEEGGAEDDVPGAVASAEHDDRGQASALAAAPVDHHSAEHDLTEDASVEADPFETGPPPKKAGRGRPRKQA